MNQEIQSIISGLQDVLSGEPWYGKSFTALAGEVSGEKIYQKPNENSHSLADLLYHMITWAEFTQYRLEKKQQDMKEVEAMDWREINPAEHTWEKGVAQFTESIEAVIRLLKDADEKLLDEKVDYREYDFRCLLHGIKEHTIYHLGQMAYVNKLVS